MQTAELKPKSLQPIIGAMESRACCDRFCFDIFNLKAVTACAACQTLISLIARFGETLGPRIAPAEHFG